MTDITYHTHTHDFIELVYIENGSAFQQVGETEFSVQKGDLLFINYKKTHAFRSENSFTFYNILLTPRFMSEELVNSENAMDLLSLNCFESFAGYREEPKISFDADEILFIESLIAKMLREYTEKPNGFEQVLKSCITVLLIHVFRKMDQGNILGGERRMPAEILEYLDNNYTEKITIQELAKRSFYNPSYFSRIFSETYGITITEYVFQKRFGRACALLEESDMTVEEVASAAGYRDTAAIFKHFKKMLHVTPAEYRKSKKKQE